jgi:hypothetical protein
MIDQLHISFKNYNWHNKGLVALDQNNIYKIQSSTKLINCHTSPEDLSYALVHEALEFAREIYLVELDFATINIINYDIAIFDLYGRLYNQLFKQRSKIVGNFSTEIVHSVPTQIQRPQQPVVWAAGCSITAGSFVLPEQRYSTLVTNALNRPEINIARGGSSIFWAADQILRSDVQAGDVVLWGITNATRVEMSNAFELTPVMLRKYVQLPSNQKLWNMNWFGSPTQTTMMLHYINQVQNFCQKTNVSLYMFNVLDTAWLSIILQKYQNYLNLVIDCKIKNDTVTYVDYGTDDLHPGPIQHQQWADQILEFINNSKKS